MEALAANSGDHATITPGLRLWSYIGLTDHLGQQIGSITFSSTASKGWPPGCCIWYGYILSQASSPGFNIGQKMKVLLFMKYSEWTETLRIQGILFDKNWKSSGWANLS